jgi:predicted NBD/HSP70 family sugar kinase
MAPNAGAAPGESGQALAREIVVRGPITRGRLAQNLGLSPASLTRLARPLLDAGILREIRTADALRPAGRPSWPLDIAHGLGTFYGVKITGATIDLAVTDLKANVSAQLSRPLRSRQPAEVAGQLAELALAHPPGAGPTGMGVCLGGQSEDGRHVEQAPYLGWLDVPLADLVEERLGVPVTVANDMVALTHGIHWFGLGRDLADFAVITIGAGVGYGLVARNRVVTRSEAGLGLAGHIPLAATGPPCHLGHTGCAEGLLTIPHLTAQAERDLGRPLPYDELLLAASEGRPRAAVDLVDQAARALGRLIALAANLTLQSTVVLGGEGIGLWDVASDQVRAAVQADRDPAAPEVRIETDFAGPVSWVRGAASLAISAAISRS